MSLTHRPPAPPPTSASPAGGRAPNPRARTRRRLLVAGLLPSLVAVAFGVEVLTTLDHDRDGRDLWGDAVYSDARGEFAANGGQLNLFERWISPFDEGTAAFGDGSYDEAVTLFEDALDVVPAEQECLVRIDLALTHEAIGDVAAEAGEGDAAAESWQSGIDALVDGDCSEDAGTTARTEDSATTEERLRAKLEQQEQQQDGDGGQGGQGNPNPDPGQGGEGDEGGDPRQDRLERRNQDGQDQRDDNQDQQDYPGFGDDYEW